MSLPDSDAPDERCGPVGLDTAELEHLQSRVQDGVVSRRQLLELGARDHDIARRRAAVIWWWPTRGSSRPTPES